MAAASDRPSGPDLSRGVRLLDLPTTGALAGHVGGEPVLLIRRPDGLFAVSGACTHYGGPLAEGRVESDVVRCPWHHACFDLRSGEPLAAPAFAPLDRWKVEAEGDRVVVRERLAAPAPRRRAAEPGQVVIVGGGAAGFAAAEMLRRRGWGGRLTMLSAEPDPPCDRPNLSKDYLAGTAPDDWIPLRDEAFYRDNDIDLRLDVEVERIDLARREAVARSGERLGWDGLLLATGAEPVRLPLPGFDRREVHMLRTPADARRLIAAAAGARTAVVIGAGFIGLEVAAALRHRGLAVNVVAPDDLPLARVLGDDLAGVVRDLHVAEGVGFHLGRSAASFDGHAVSLTDGAALAADLVVVGVGVRPRVRLAAEAGLGVDDGVLVDRTMRTSAPGVWAAGDVARYPGPGDAPIRIEHWVAAQRQGQVAALSMLGEPGGDLIDPPFFWSLHYDAAIRYVGHAAEWDEVRIDGDLGARDATVRYLKAGRLQAAASLGRDADNLRLADELRAAAAAAQPPPTNWTSSIRSPSASAVEA